MKRFLFFILMFLLLYCLIEVSSLFGLAVLKKFRHIDYTPLLTASLSQDHQQTLHDLIDGKTTYLLHSPLLGWAIKPHGYWDDLYRANAQGIRADRDYQAFPTGSVVRIATFGDSFTHGDDIKNEFTWQEQLNRLNHNLEVINFGVGGYGLDQAFLRYRQDGVQYNPHLVFIGFMEENINRLVNVFRPFYYPGIPLTKPRFIIREDTLTLLPNPLAGVNDCKMLLHDPRPLLAAFAKHDFHYSVGLKDGALDFLPSIRMFKLLYHQAYDRYLEYTDRSIYLHGYFNPRSEAFSICTRLFDEFYREVLKHNAVPVILLFPNQSDIERYRKGKTTVYTPLVHYITSRGYRFIDLVHAFEKRSASARLEDFFGNSHYSAQGNAIVAQFILSYLHDNDLTTMNSIKNKLIQEQNTVQRTQLIKEP